MYVSLYISLSSFIYVRLRDGGLTLACVINYLTYLQELTEFDTFHLESVRRHDEYQQAYLEEVRLKR